MSEPERFPLDDAAIALLAEINAQMRALDSMWRGAQALFLRQHNLQGEWRPDANGRELVQVQTEPKEIPT